MPGAAATPSARWAGRLELIVTQAGGRPREVLLDGAHNPDGAAALAQALDDLAPYLAGGGAEPPEPPVLVWASMADKDVAGMLRALAASSVVSARHASSAPRSTSRAPCPPTDLAAVWRAALPGARVVVEPDPAPRWTARSRPATGRSSSPGRCTSSGRRGRASSTTRSCATRSAA